MSVIQSNIERPAATAAGERVGPGLSGPRSAVGPQAIRRTSTHAREGLTEPQRSVMDKLLGASSLAAHDERGSDPYNATGRQFRR
jgi:hypothetical protein